MTEEAPEGCKRLRVLILTNHLRWFGGSEIVALEVARAFAAMGDDVFMAANIIREPFAELVQDFSPTDDVAGLDLQSFDLVWCQHDLLGLLPMAAFEAAANGNLPHIVYVSMSPYEQYEHLNGIAARAFSAEVFANSEETADVVAASNSGLVERNTIRVFQNAAPPEFWRRQAWPKQPDQLRSVLLVSNHPPDEIITAMDILDAQGVAIHRIGLGGEARLLRAEDIESVDGVVSIGKTVAYAIALEKPAFIYDHFGGDGWLTNDNFERNRYFNFSGRPGLRRLSPTDLSAAIQTGYVEAARFASRLSYTVDLSAFRLAPQLRELRHRVILRNRGLAGWSRRARLASALKRGAFRAHMETTRRKLELMRLFHRHIELSG